MSPADSFQKLREGLVYRAKVAEQAERYDDMGEAMKDLVQAIFEEGKGELSVEERNCFSIAYKNAVGARRVSWRIISSVEQKEQSKGNHVHKALATLYREKVEEELRTICEEVLDLLANKLIPHGSDSESVVFYYKMKGDYYRYISEFAKEHEHQPVVDDAAAAYQKACEVAEAELPTTNPIRLGLALNYSVFYYEILKQPGHACQMAKRAFDDAIIEFDSVNEDSYKDSTLIMQLLRDNLTIWTSDGLADSAGGECSTLTNSDKRADHEREEVVEPGVIA